MPAQIPQLRVDHAERRVTLLAMPNHGRVVTLPSRPGPVIDFSPELTGRQRYLWAFYGKSFESVEQAETVRAAINESAKHMPLRDAVSQFRSPRSKTDSVWSVCERFIVAAPVTGSERTRCQYSPRTLVHYEALLRRARPGFADMGMRQFFQPPQLNEFRAWFRRPKDSGGRGLKSDTEMANAMIALRAVVRWYQTIHPDFVVRWPSITTKLNIAKQDKKRSRSRDNRRGRLKLQLADVVTIICQIPEAKQPIFWVMFFTQCRPTEARAVLGCDYVDGRIYIERSAAGPASTAAILDKTKNDHDGDYLMPPFVQELIQQHCTGARFDEKTPLFKNCHPQAVGPLWGEDALRQMWKRATDRSGLPWMPVYQALKHTQVSALRAFGVSRDDIVEQCRWASAEMLESYDDGRPERDGVVVTLGELAEEPRRKARQGGES